MKYVFYVLGILILTLGISFTIQSDLGTSPFDALLVQQQVLISKLKYLNLEFLILVSYR